jgi:hypothetical protein
MCICWQKQTLASSASCNVPLWLHADWSSRKWHTLLQLKDLWRFGTLIRSSSSSFRNSYKLSECMYFLKWKITEMRDDLFAQDLHLGQRAEHSSKELRPSERKMKIFSVDFTSTSPYFNVNKHTFVSYCKRKKKLFWIQIFRLWNRSAIRIIIRGQLNSVLIKDISTGPFRRKPRLFERKI